MKTARNLGFIIGALLVLSAGFNINAAYGHGGSALAPVKFGGGQAATFINLTPTNLVAGQFDEANLHLSFFNQANLKPIPNTTYNVEILNRDGDVLMRGQFFAQDGSIDIKVEPTECNKPKVIDCQVIQGAKEPTLGGYYGHGGQRATVKTAAFEGGGLFKINAQILSAESPRKLAQGSINFDAFINIPKLMSFPLKDAAAEQVKVKAYHAPINKVSYDSNQNEFTFEMPFDWSKQNVDQMLWVHLDPLVPKQIVGSDNPAIEASIDGVLIQETSVFGEKYSAPEFTTHVLVEKSELQQIRNKRGVDMPNDMMQYKIKLGQEIPINSYNADFKTGASAQVSWPKTYGAGDEIPLKFTFFGPDGNLLPDVRYGFVIKDQSGNEVFKKIGKQQLGPGNVALEGIDIKNAKINKEGTYKLDVAIFGQGPKYDKTYQGLGSTQITVEKPLENGNLSKDKQAMEGKKQIVLPDWVKRNAKWWSEGKVGDRDFAKGIEYMIKQGIINVPVSGQDKDQSQDEDKVDIPAWVKQSAKWWSEGKVGDRDFAKGIEHLIKIGVIGI